MEPAPGPALCAVLRAPGPALPRLLDVAAAEAELVLGRPFASKVILAPVDRERRLDHGSILRPAGDFPWDASFLYRSTWDARRLCDSLGRHAPLAFGAVTAIVTDVEIEPPPDWRYMIFRRLSRGARTVISVAPLDPLFWGEGTARRLRILKRRLRAALVAALAPALGLPACDEPGCFFDATVSGVDSLDAMETVGPIHRSHPLCGRRFAVTASHREVAPLLAAPGRAATEHPRAFERRPARPLPVEVRWEAGPTAALEIFHVTRLPGESLSLTRRHETPWAPVVRPPVERISLSAPALAAVREAMEQAISGARFRGINLPFPPAAARPGTPAAIDALRLAGSRLYDLLFPLALERGLTRKGVFLELGIDEQLLEEPFELMHDHQGFLALRHFPGRFVNVSRAWPSAHRGPLDRAEPGQRQLRALVVAAGTSALAPDRPLPHAEAEAEATVEALAALGARTTALLGRRATAAAVYAALRTGPHLFHYSGHAELGSSPARRRLLLADDGLDAEALGHATLRRPPAVMVLNACEAGRAPSFAGAARMQGLIDALLVAGSYVVAARWPVTDAAAAAFARAFYGELLERGGAIGVAVTRGREAARAAAPADDLTWAAYVLYGDPKLALGPRRR